MVESFLTSAVEELDCSVVPAEIGMLSKMDMEFTKESEQINSKAYTFDGEAGTRDLTCFTPSPQLPLAYTMADLITGAIVDTTRSVNSQSPIADVGGLCLAGRWFTMSDDDACPRPRLCTEHFDLAADDSQDEGLADDMHGCELARPCRTATLHRVMVGHTARRWPVRRRGTCEVRGHHSKVQGELDSNEEGDANHGRQDRSLCGVGRLH